MDEERPETSYTSNIEKVDELTMAKAIEFEKAYEIRMTVTGTLEDFALTVLKLTSLKSNTDLVYDFRTYAGEDFIIVQASEDISSEFNGVEIDHVNEIQVAMLNENAFKGSVLDEMEDLIYSDEEYHFIIEDGVFN